MAHRYRKANLIYGVALVLMGVGVFFRIPQVMPKIAQIEWFASAMGLVRFCFYLLGALLIFGGGKKIHKHYHGIAADESDS